MKTLRLFYNKLLELPRKNKLFIRKCYAHGHKEQPVQEIINELVAQAEDFLTLSTKISA